jgi:hypothetical protein
MGQENKEEVDMEQFKYDKAEPFDLVDVMLRCQMDFKNKIASFEEIGMLNPDNVYKSMTKAKQVANKLDFYHDIYKGAEVKDYKYLKTSHCVFIPEREILQEMINTVLRYGGTNSNKANFLLRFGLFENVDR